MSLKPVFQKKLIRKLAEELKIPFLCHFTKTANLPSILEYGILSRSVANLKKINLSFNDTSRLDGHCDASCFTISFPNYKMFYTLRRNDDRSNWVVLTYSPAILWELDCAFCITNAANSCVSSQDVATLKTFSAFEKLFKTQPSQPDRSKLGVPEWFPTDPQAEVLIFDNISPAYLVAVACDSRDTLDTMKTHCQKYNVPISINSAFYSYRPDYEYWKSDGK